MPRATSKLELLKTRMKMRRIRNAASKTLQKIPSFMTLSFSSVEESDEPSDDDDDGWSLRTIGEGGANNPLRRLRQQQQQQIQPATRPPRRWHSTPELASLTEGSGGDSDSGNPSDRRAALKRRASTTSISSSAANLWLSSYLRLDPRHQILTYFDDLAREGGDGIEKLLRSSYSEREEVKNPLLKVFARASAFSVWRPTSKDAIRKMMMGEVTGKGLDVKGKSAKRGALSGLIPFVQIHEDSHKKQVRWPPKDGRIRIYFNSREARDGAMEGLGSVAQEMMAAVSTAKEILAIPDDGSDESRRESAMERLIWDMTDPRMDRLDDYAYSSDCYGIDVAERLFFEACIVRRDITRTPGSDYDTGRPSEPAFQDMNFACTRKEHNGHGPRAVILQMSESDQEDALRPLSFVVAYEECGKVTPVASDFDCFTLGTRGVTYDSPLPPDQVDLLGWQMSQIETILDSPTTAESWTKRWLDVLKKSASMGFQPTMPPYGFGDPKSYAIMKGAVTRLALKNGAVRHGAECFNYYFPQELDQEFLVICDTLPGKVPWKYVDVHELQDMLCRKIDEGFTFPLNPKWILADDGWKRVYDKMMSSPNVAVQKSLDAWYPPAIRERIESIHSRHPDGFRRLASKADPDDDGEEGKFSGTEAMDLAEQELKYHLILQRAKLKLRCALAFTQLLNDTKAKRASANMCCRSIGVGNF